MRLDGPVQRISVGDPTIADVTLISASELYLLGKSYGTTNLIVWGKDGITTVIDISTALDVVGLKGHLRELLPGETAIEVRSAADAIVLSGTVSNAIRASHAVAIAEAFGRRAPTGVSAAYAVGGSGETVSGQASPSTSRQRSAVRAESGPLRVVNMMRVDSPQQVMLEVKVAEVSKTLLDKLGVGADFSRTNGDWRYSILSNLMTGSAGILGLAERANSLQIDAEKRDALVRILAEPNIISLSGQEASFLAGGRIFIPVSRADRATGVPAITLEEREFGVGLKFTPIVLDGDRINLQVAPEVSELSQAGSPFTAINGSTAILPSFTTRRAQTTVQLRDGQSFAIAGLIRNNVTESIRRFPILGELPILGALFRSSEFQTDRTELMFIVTPRLVRPLAAEPVLPTDHWIAPTREQFFLEGMMEGRP